jgi:hypothetical protein
MSFLADYHGDRAQRDTPERVYARRDEDASAELGARVFDAVDADWFDAVRGGPPWLMDDPGLDSRVSVAVVAPSESWRSLDHPDRREGWLHLRLAPSAGGDVDHYLSLFSPPERQELTAAYPAPGDIADELERQHDMSALPDADPQDIRGLLDATEEADAAAVYDVGQGAACALIATDHPVMYFDLGGGCLWNASTYPKGLNKFCFCVPQLVVLSHFDRDHWCSAIKDPDALDQTWIVPRQPLKPTQLAFLVKLVRRAAAVHVFPAGQGSLSGGRAELVPCAGQPMNDSGLALNFLGPDESRMLFPADGAYDHVAGATAHVTSLTVTHHGGRSGSTFVPPPDGAAHGRLVYSYGPGNRYCHPLAKEEAEHTAMWGAHSLRTATRPGGATGHVHLYWDDAAPDARTGCSSTCDLDVCQRR